jgi:hypothetical protein
MLHPHYNRVSYDAALEGDIQGVQSRAAVGPPLGKFGRGVGAAWLGTDGTEMS